VRTSYNAFYFVTLKPWSERTTRAEQYQEIKARLNQQLGRLPQGTVFSFSPPAIPGVGTCGGFQFVLEDRAGRDVQFLANNLNKFLAAARKRPEIGTISTTFLPSVPQRFADVDRDKVLKQGVAVSDVYQTIQAFMGGLFVNYFNDFGRTWQVYVEAEAPYRSSLDSVGQFYVRNSSNSMVPLTALTKFESRNGPEFTMRYNEYRSAQINGKAAPGYSSDQATAALEDVFRQTTRLSRDGAFPLPRSFVLSQNRNWGEASLNLLSFEVDLWGRLRRATEAARANLLSAMSGEMGYDYMGMSYQEQQARQGVSARSLDPVRYRSIALVRLQGLGGAESRKQKQQCELPEHIATGYCPNSHEYYESSHKPRIWFSHDMGARRSPKKLPVSDAFVPTIWHLP
jgi:AcrB/AcrD/AcrF family